MKSTNLFFFLLLIFVSCTADDYVTETIIVASQKAIATEPSGGSEREYFLIKTNDSDVWEYLTPNIQGFNYEEGFEYVLKVGITTISKPAQDQYPKAYVLIEIISKTEKQSENLPIV